MVQALATQESPNLVLQIPRTSGERRQGKAPNQQVNPENEDCYVQGEASLVSCSCF